MSLVYIWLKLALFFCLALGRSQTGFTWRQCDDQQTFLLEHLDVKPYPVKIPGDMVFSLNMTLLRELNGSDIFISIYWKTFMGNIRIPCLFNLGSCTYRNACTLMDRIIRENWGGFMSSFASQIKNILINNGVSLLCPVQPQDIRLQNEQLRMPTIPSFLSYFTGGDYLVKVSTVSEEQKEETFCLDMSGA